MPVDLSTLKVILASQSPRRTDLLDLIGVEHEVKPAAETAPEVEDTQVAPPPSPAAPEIRRLAG